MKLTFIGAGSMAEAIVGGLLANATVKKEHITMLNKYDVARKERLQTQYGVQTYLLSDADAYATISAADVIFIAVKPKDVQALLTEVAPYIAATTLCISVAAGVTIESIKRLLHDAATPIVRTMPNTSSTIRLGATGVSFSAEVSAEQQQLALTLLQAIGMVTVVEERYMDTVTALSGSGPAYFYLIMEAMMQAGIAQGLTAEQAKQLTIQTALGAATMAAQTGEEPAILRQKVTSPNGTTYAALTHMQQADVAGIFAQAMEKAQARALEMGQDIAAAIK